MRNQNSNTLPLIDLVRYLKDVGWTLAEHPNDKLILFRGPLNDSGKPLEIAIPKNVHYQDYNSRVNDALRIISILKGKDIKEITKEVLLTSHDIFKVRILDTGGYSNSISLPYASNSLKSLKDLFVYGACSEQVSLPYFDTPLQVGINHAHLCRFGHTFEGSFGLSISSPIVNEYVQIDMFEEQNALPFERKVMERIIRGIDLLGQSVNEDNGDILVNSYDVAFNSKMCESLLDLSSNKTIRIGLDVEWSSKFEVSEDIKNKNNWILSEASYAILEYAAEELKKIEPYNETIIGNIVTLHSNKNPMSDENFLRQATIKHEINGKKVLVKLDLDKESYTVAYEAHGKGLPIKASGVLYKKGNTWRMVEVTEVSVIT
ncbi:hypothetical protein [Brevibacillus brevis]|uniref:Uncharacterized protein n=1 Tax=Brevibacillus brevis TaxID=1393 RepID=A0A517I9F7_BREBE|nr:hypothetical protein [Brevibacillus brevis]QDS35517.1 hypothetical protein FPS98_16705 [Brevibacillus brevis]